MGIIQRSLLSLVAVLLLTGCAAGAGVSQPPASSGGGPVTTEDQAVARVVAHEPRLAGIAKRDPEMIGQANWYEVAPASGVGAFIVTVRLGWGDCQAGCIEEHTWVYAVLPDGTVNQQSEGGGQVPDAAWPSPGAGGDAGRTGLLVTAVAGPVCPVERVPPDPACAPKPVPGALIDVTSADEGQSVARQQTDASGTTFLDVAPGRYVLTVTDARERFMGLPEPQVIVVEAGRVTEVTFAFDTGIR